MAATVTIRWTAHRRLSAIHAAYVVATGSRCVDPRTEQALVGPVTDLNNRLLSASIDVGAFWRRLMVEVAADGDDSGRADARACEIALLAGGISELLREQTAPAIARRLSECRSAYAQRFPKLAEQLPLRARPLIERWEAFGPGLLKQVADTIWQGSPPGDWWPSRIQGLLIQPTRGGDGGFDTDAQRLWVEAMLTDADPAVPEVLRVALLVTQLAIDAHTREKSGEQSQSLPWSLASVPLVLSAADELQLLPPGPLPVRAAMTLWHIGDERTAEIVAPWWQQLRASRTPLPVALKALKRMCQSGQVDRPQRHVPLENLTERRNPDGS